MTVTALYEVPCGVCARSRSLDDDSRRRGQDPVPGLPAPSNIARDAVESAVRKGAMGEGRN